MADDFSKVVQQLEVTNQKLATSASKESIEDLSSTLSGDIKKSNEKLQKVVNNQIKEEKNNKKTKLGDLASVAKEKAKDKATYLNKLLGNYLGKAGSPLMKMLGSIKKTFGTRVLGGITTLWGLVKKGVFLAAIFLLVKFFDSDIWKKWKDNLIPYMVTAFEKITEFWESTKKWFDDEWPYYKDSIMTSMRSFGSSLKRIFEAFFGGKATGPGGSFKTKGSFLGGINQIFIEIFGENNRVLWAFKQIGKWMGTFADGLLDVVTLIKGEDAKGNKIDRWQHFKENWGEMIGSIALLAAALAPKLMFGTLKIGGKLAWRAVKGISQWLFFKPMKTAIIALLSSLGFLTKGIDDAAVTTMGGAMRSPFGAVKGRSYNLKGQGKFKWMGQQFVDVATGKVATTGQAAALRQGISGGSIRAMGVAGGLANYVAEMADKFPKVHKAITRGIPILGGLLTTYAASSILMSDTSRDEKVKALGGLLFGTLGAGGLSWLGATGGFAIGGPFGAVGGALLGGVGGFLGGDAMGQYLADFLLDGSTKKGKYGSDFGLSTGAGNPDIAMKMGTAESWRVMHENLPNNETKAENIIPNRTSKGLGSMVGGRGGQIINNISNSKEIVNHDSSGGGVISNNDPIIATYSTLSRF